MTLATARPQVGWLRRAGLSYHRATVCAHARSDPKTAIRWIENVLRIWRMQPDHPRQPYNESAAHITLGGLLETRTEYREARAHLTRALEILEPLRTKDVRHASAHAAALGNLARVHRALGDHDEAIRLLTRALEVNRSSGYEPGIAWSPKSQSTSVLE